MKLETTEVTKPRAQIIFEIILIFVVASSFAYRFLAVESPTTISKWNLGLRAGAILGILVLSYFKKYISLKKRRVLVFLFILMFILSFVIIYVSEGRVF